MAYRDDFYCVANIIGYTGALHRDPTVYFRHGEEYGRITQEHGYSQNVGRSEVVADGDYFIRNSLIHGRHACTEGTFDGDAEVILHVSRHAFHPVAGETMREVLAQAIWRYPDEKYISHYSRQDRRLITAVQKRKHLVHLQLMSVHHELQALDRAGA